MRRTAGIDVGGFAEAGDTSDGAASATRPGETGGVDLQRDSAPARIEEEALFAQERTRWAYEIHDGLTQVITAAVLELGWLADLIEHDPRAAIEMIEETRAEMRAGLDELRRIMFQLTEGSSPAADRAEPLSTYAHQAAKRWRLPATVTVTGDVPVLSSEALGGAFAVIGEGIANAAKHAGAPDVVVRIRAAEDELDIEVVDRGRGFQPESADGKASHFGLSIMRFKVEEAGGTLAIESSEGQGTRVAAQLPVRRQGVEP